ncbi:hypothetical protein BH18CHL2_BH18CHL2_03180 [soil metagenome]
MAAFGRATWLSPATSAVVTTMSAVSIAENWIAATKDWIT